MEIRGGSLDELLGKAYGALLKKGRKISPTKGECLELIDVVLKLNNPRARFSSTEKRGTVLFSALGEMLWCFSGSDKLDFIEHYIPKYRKFINADEKAEIAPGAYGPRLFKADKRPEQRRELFDSLSQIDVVINLLKGKSATRQAVLQVFNKSDLEQSKGDIPCTCTIQLLCRDKILHMLVYMRSNDAWRGLPPDVFVFTFLQEYIARSIGVELGNYTHHVGSFHIYTTNKSDKDNKTDRDRAEEFLKEAPYEKIAMPAMPKGNLNSAMLWLLGVEKGIRDKKILPDFDLIKIEAYWKDIARLLVIKHHFDNKKIKNLLAVAEDMDSQVYRKFIESRARKIQRANRKLPLFPSL